MTVKGVTVKGSDCKGKCFQGGVTVRGSDCKGE